MIVVIAVLALLLVSGVSLLGGTGGPSRKAAADLLSGLVEQGRTTAITSRRHVLLAVAGPDDLPAGDGRYRLALFKVDEWPEGSGTVEPLNATLLNRWQAVNTGVIFIGGAVDGIDNPLDGPRTGIRYGVGGREMEISVHAIGFTPRGGLRLPAGSRPVVFRMAEGGYRGGRAVPDLRGDDRSMIETRLRIGRVIARSYRMD
jgi:hypothetical protein